MILGLIKFFLFALLMVIFILHHTLVSLFLWNEETRLKYFLQSIKYTCRIGLWILNVKVSYQGSRGEVKQKLIVANHLSYLDVLILFSYFPSLFVTSTEIRDTFFLGRICKLAGCFFVERRKSMHLPGTKDLELKQMKDKLAQGFNIFLFPEGTSSDGASVLPFKGTFFKLAIDSGTNIKPMVLKYTGENAHLPPWYGEMTFIDHLFKLCLQNEISAKLGTLDELAGTEKMELAKNSHYLIREAYAGY